VKGQALKKLEEAHVGLELWRLKWFPRREELSMDCHEGIPVCTRGFCDSESWVWCGGWVIGITPLMRGGESISDGSENRHLNP